ncbi:MAG: universal stress protein [Pirellulaceae bacterium]
MKRFRNILVSLDTSAAVHPALERAVDLATHSGAKLKLMDVVHEAQWPVSMLLPNVEHLLELEREEKHQQLEAVAASVREKGVDVSVTTGLGKTSLELIHEVMRGDHDLVIRTARGVHSWRNGFFGTTSFRLLRKCPCPVWIVRPNPPQKLSHVLAAVDPTWHDEAHAELNHTIVSLANGLSELESCRVTILHAWSIYGEHLLRSKMSDSEFADVQSQSQRAVEKVFNEFLAKYSLNSQSGGVRLIKGESAVVIPEFVREQNVDVLVMGTVGRSGVSGLLMGNTCEHILNEVQCSVLALKPAGFHTPVTLPE